MSKLQQFFVMIQQSLDCELDLKMRILRKCHIQYGTGKDIIDCKFLWIIIYFIDLIINTGFVLLSQISLSFIITTKCNQQTVLFSLQKHSKFLLEQDLIHIIQSMTYFKPFALETWQLRIIGNVAQQQEMEILISL